MQGGPFAQMIGHLIGGGAAMLLDPPLIVLAAIAGLAARRWAHVAIGAIIAGALYQLLLLLIGRQFLLDYLVAGMLAAYVWAAASYALLGRRIGRTPSS
jgi:hypothetical protein